MSNINNNHRDIWDEIYSDAPFEMECGRCGKSTLLLTMEPFQEVEDYLLALPEHPFTNGPKPVLPPDEYFMQKYG